MSLANQVPYCHPSNNATIETISPLRAQDYLKRNAGNRPVTNSKVLEYSRAMKEGKWIVNGQTIIFDENGDLRNGQHRLLACVKAGVAFTTYVVRGIADDAFPTLDVGKTRNASDNLGIIGGKNTNEMASAIRWAMRIMTGHGGAHPKFFNPSIEEVMDFYQANKSIERSIQSTWSCAKVAPRGLCAALHFLFAEKDENQANVFFQELASGAELLSFDPVHLLRENLMKAKNQRIPLPTQEVGARIVRAWNLRRQGLSANRAPQGTKNGQFPTIL